ncbi:MAG: endonuclease/exonuclease/phosphatase family protein [Planctomycetales bacterium]
MRRRRRFLALFIGLPLATCLVWFAVVRVASPWNRVRIHADESAAAHAESSEAASDSALALRIAAYNIAHGRGAGDDNWKGGSAEERASRLERIAMFLKDADLDLVVLNEVDFDAAWSGGVNQAEAIARAAKFSYRVEQRNIDLALPVFSLRFGNAVLSRYPIVEARAIDFPAYAAWETALAGKKRGLACTIRLDDARELRLIAVHLDDRSESVRLAAAEMIRAEKASTTLPVIVAGDFNSAPPGFPLAQPDADGRTALGNLVGEAGFHTLPSEPPEAAGLTFPSTAPDRVLDWVLAAPPARLVSREVYPIEESDHRPVIGVVRLPAGE